MSSFRFSLHRQHYFRLFNDSIWMNPKLPNSPRCIAPRCSSSCNIQNSARAKSGNRSEMSSLAKESDPPHQVWQSMFTFRGIVHKFSYSLIPFDTDSDAELLHERISSCEAKAVMVQSSQQIEHQHAAEV